MGEFAADSLQIAQTVKIASLNGCSGAIMKGDLKGRDQT
jgi:hypothetical protein